MQERNLCLQGILFFTFWFECFILHLKIYQDFQEMGPRFQIWLKVSKIKVMGADSSNKGCFGRKTNLFRESEDFAGNRETWQVFWEIWDIFRTMSKDLILHVIKQYICTVICTMCMHCILCILMTLDMKRPISNVSNWSSMKLECNWLHAIPSGLTRRPYRCKTHTISILSWKWYPEQFQKRHKI